MHCRSTRYWHLGIYSIPQIQTMWSFIGQVIYRHWLRVSKIRRYGLIKHYHYTKKVLWQCVMVTPWYFVFTMELNYAFSHVLWYLHYMVFQISSNKYGNTTVLCVSELMWKGLYETVEVESSGVTLISSDNILIKYSGIMWHYWCASISSDKRNDSLLQQ